MTKGVGETNQGSCTLGIQRNFDNAGIYRIIFESFFTTELEHTAHRMHWWYNLTTSDYYGIWRGIFQLTSVPVLSDVVIFCSSMVILTAKEQFLGCATVAFSGRYCRRVPMCPFAVTGIWRFVALGISASSILYSLFAVWYFLQWMSC
jgi:hypothetical protein